MSEFLDRDALELIQETAVKAAAAAGKVQVLDLPKEPPHVYGLVKSDGSFERVEAAAAPRKHKLLSVHQVGDFVKQAMERLEVAPTVWYSPNGVTIVLDDGKAPNLAGQATVPLTYTPQFELLRALEKLRPMSQKEFVRLLRTQLADCLTEDAAMVLRQARSLNFREQTSGHGKIDQGRESLGREIESEVTSEVGKLGEYVTLEVRIFTDPALIIRRSVRCALDVNAAEYTLALQPLPLELDNALQTEMEHLEGMLEQATEVPVFYGTP